MMKRSASRLSHLLLACGIGGALLFGASAMAFPPNTLSEALTRSVDAARQRTPLLIVDAEGTRQDRENVAVRKKLDALYASDNAKPPLFAVLEGYNRQIISCSSVQVVAPLMRIVLNPDLGPPEEWVDFGPDQAAKKLLRSLTDAQWDQVSSPEGLGLNNLNSPEQKAIFRAVFPKSFALQQTTLREKGGAPYPDLGELHRVAPEEARLRIVRKMSWSYRTQDGAVRGTTTILPFSYEGHKVGDTYWTQAELSDVRSTYPESLWNVVRLRTPNKLKRSDLGFNTAPLYGKVIALDGAETVGELVRRVAEKTAVEIYADRRVSGLKVLAIGPAGATADAADVMKALCYAVSGTIRKVDDGAGGAVYILAYDQQGLAPTRLKLAEWAADLEALHQDAEDDFQNTVGGEKILAKLGFGDSESRLAPDVMARFETDWKASRGSHKGSPGVAIKHLPAELQQRVAGELAQVAPSAKGILDNNNIYPSFNIQLEITVPGYGTFEGPKIGALESFLARGMAKPDSAPRMPTGAKIALPDSFTGFAALKIASKSDVETDRFIAWAKRHGFNKLFVATSLWDEGDAARLTHAVAAGKASGIAVYPAVSLWKVPPRSDAQADVAPNDLPRSKNVFGETLPHYAVRRKNAPGLRRRRYAGDEAIPATDEDWLDGEQQSVRESLARQLQKVAATPGIAGVVLADGAAPGFDITDFLLTGSVAGSFGGYTEGLRAALIRRTNIDPVDLLPYEALAPYFESSMEELVPFFVVGEMSYNQFSQFPVYRRDRSQGTWEKVDEKEDADGWDTLRREKNRDWVEDIRKRAILPAALPVYWEATAQSPYDPASWIALWNPGKTLPPDNPEASPLARVDITPDAGAWEVQSQFKDLTRISQSVKEARYTGVVVDVSKIRMDKALTLLDVLAPVP